MLHSTVITTKDLTEQPESTHLLVVGGKDGKPVGGYACNWLQFPKDAPIVQAMLGSRIVFCCHIEAAWNFISRDVLTLQSEEALIRSSAEHVKKTQDLIKELSPGDAIQLAVEDLDGDGTGRHRHGPYL